MPVGADVRPGRNHAGIPPGHTGTMSTPRDPRGDDDVETRAWAGRDDETRRVGGDTDRATHRSDPTASDPTVAYGGAPTYGSDPTVAYGGAPSYGSDPTAAYGNTGAAHGNTSPYGNTGSTYGNTAAQQAGTPNHPPTVQYPSTGAWSNPYGQNTSTYREETAGYGQAPGAGGYAPPPPGDHRPQPTPHRGGGRKTGRTVLIAVTVLVLLFLLGLLAWGLQSTGNSSDSAAGQTSAPPVPTTRAPTTAPPTTNPAAPLPLPSIELPSIPGLDSLPDLGDAIGSSGVTMGSISSLGDSSIVVDGLAGPVTVTITPSTEIVGLNATSLADLSVGEQVVVEGTPVQDGRTTAIRIVSTRLPGN